MSFLTKSNIDFFDTRYVVSQVFLEKSEMLLKFIVYT